MIITAANKEFSDILDISIQQNEKLGYEPHVYSLDDSLGFGEVFNISQRIKSLGGTGRCPWKAELIKKALNNFTCPLTWMDADAFAIRKFDELDNQEFDVGVCLRRLEERNLYNPINRYGYINSGVMFFRYNDKTLNFVDIWDKEIEKSDSKSCQEALNNMLLGVDDLNSRDKTINFNGTLVRLLKTEDYNYYYFDEPLPSSTKIVHFKGSKRTKQNIDKIINI